MPNERTDRQKADGTLTKQDVDDVSMRLIAAARHLDMALETDGINQMRHIALAVKEVSEARMSAKNASFRLANGK